MLSKKALVLDCLQLDHRLVVPWCVARMLTSFDEEASPCSFAHTLPLFCAAV